MIATIARRELTDVARDGRFRWAGATILLLLLAALAAGGIHARDARRQQEAAQQLMRQQWVNQGERNPHSAAHIGIWAFRPTPPLATMDPGVSPYVGVAVWLEAHRWNELRYRPARDATAVGRFGALTAATVLQLLVPLVVILLAFGAFAGEREGGTLRLLLSLGVPRRTILAGKALGVAGALGALLVPATAVGVLALALTSPAGVRAEDVGALALAAAGYLLYFGAFVGLSLAASALAPTSRVALLALLAFWSFNALAAPRAAADVARRLHPTPLAVELTEGVLADQRQGIDGHDPQNARTAALRERLLQQYGVSTVDSLPIDFEGVALQAGEEYGTRAYERRYAALWSAFERQHDVYSAGSVVAPLLAVRALSMGLAGTDWARQRDFARRAEEWRRMMVRAMNDEMAYNSVVKGFDGNVRGREVWERVPDFAYAPPPLSAAVARQGGSFAVLALWCAGAGLLATAAVARLRPEW